MRTRTIPYTEKFPFMYQVELNGYIIETTNKGRFDKLVEYLKTTNEKYMDIPVAKRCQIESAFTVRRFENAGRFNKFEEGGIC